SISGPVGGCVCAGGTRVAATLHLVGQPCFSPPCQLRPDSASCKRPRSRRQRSRISNCEGNGTARLDMSALIRGRLRQAARKELTVPVWMCLLYTHHPRSVSCRV